jgi:hypothetical protein
MKGRIIQMANKINVEEQVAQLSQEQQDKIYKVGIIALVLQLIGGIPWFIGVVSCLYTMIALPASFDLANYDKLFIGFIVWLILGAAYVIGISVFVKIKFPYYSDAKWNYINKMRKGK